MKYLSTPLFDFKRETRATGGGGTGNGRVESSGGRLRLLAFFSNDIIASINSHADRCPVCLMKGTIISLQ